MRLAITAFLLAILLSGCSSEEHQDKANGDQGLNNTRQSASGSSGDKISDREKSIKTIAFEKEQRFGSTDEAVVGNITVYAVDGQNRVFIADIGQTTDVFSPDGCYLTSLGRQGKGPGEFNEITPRTVMNIHSNLIYITDGFYQARAHVYLLNDLSFSHTVKLRAENRNDFEQLKGYYPRRVYPRNDGTFLVSYHRSQFEYKDDVSYIRYVVQDSTATIVSGPILEQKNRTYLINEYPNGSTKMHSFPFFGKSLLAVSDDDHLFTARTEEFKINIYTPHGDHVRTFQHSFENKPLNRSRLIDRYEKTNYMAQLGDGVAIKMIREAESLPDHWPALETMFFDDEERLWVATIVEDFDVYEWWILKKSGEVITKFKWPRDEPIEEVRNGYMYTRETDERGVENIIKYKIKMDEE